MADIEYKRLKYEYKLRKIQNTQNAGMKWFHRKNKVEPIEDERTKDARLKAEKDAERRAYQADAIKAHYLDEQTQRIYEEQERRIAEQNATNKQPVMFYRL